MYKVISAFADAQDSNTVYQVGDSYPRKGAKVLPARLAELASHSNRIGHPLIEEVQEAKTSKRKE